jgi:hypothetical protein
MLDKLDLLINSIENGPIKDRIVALASGIRPRDYIRVDIKELEGLIDPDKVSVTEPLGSVEIKL